MLGSESVAKRIPLHTTVPICESGGRTCGRSVAQEVKVCVWWGDSWFHIGVTGHYQDGAKEMP